MGRRLAIGGALLLVVAACLAPVQTTWDDGLWPLSVTVVSASGSPIASASAEAFSSEDRARSSLEHLTPPETRVHSAAADPFAGGPLSVPVPTSSKTRSALMWSQSQYNQMRLLVVIVRYRDGRRQGRLVEIPDLRRERALAVEVP